MAYIYPLTYLILLMALASFSMSLLIFIRKRPLVVNFAFLLIISIAELIISYLLCIYKSPAVLESLPILILVILAALFSGYIMKGIMVYGVTYADLQDKIVDYLNTKNVEFEQIQTEIYIKKINIRLLFSYNDKFGYTRIMFKGKNSRLLINSIINELRLRNLKVNLSYSVFALVCGVLSTITYFVLKSLNHL